MIGSYETQQIHAYNMLAMEFYGLNVRMMSETRSLLIKIVSLYSSANTIIVFSTNTCTLMNAVALHCKQNDGKLNSNEFSAVKNFFQDTKERFIPQKSLCTNQVKKNKPPDSLEYLRNKKAPWNEHK